MSTSLTAFMLYKQLIITIQRHSNTPNKEMLSLLQFYVLEKVGGYPSSQAVKLH